MALQIKLRSYLALLLCSLLLTLQLHAQTQAGNTEKSDKAELRQALQLGRLQGVEKLHGGQGLFALGVLDLGFALPGFLAAFQQGDLVGGQSRLQAGPPQGVDQPKAHGAVDGVGAGGPLRP